MQIAQPDWHVLLDSANAVFAALTDRNALSRSQPMPSVAAVIAHFTVVKVFAQIQNLPFLRSMQMAI
jgi:hypothetical protein